MNKTEITFDSVAEDIAAALSSDSGIPVSESKEKIREALVADNFGSPVQHLPSKDEIELLVMGDDEGQVPTRLQKRWPKLHEVLGSFF